VRLNPHTIEELKETIQKEILSAVRLQYFVHHQQRGMTRYLGRTTHYSESINRRKGISSSTWLGIPKHIPHYWFAKQNRYGYKQLWDVQACPGYKLTQA
jgi:hypothetical protein